MARLYTMRALAPVVVLLACHHDGRAPEPTGRTEVPPPRDDRVVTAPEPPGAPPGTDAVVRVPAAVADRIVLREVARGFARPVLVTFAPGDARRRLFVVEQRGKIRTIEGGAIAARPFFEIDKLSGANEQGLLGLAFHPAFATNGRLYVDFTTKDKHTHVVEYRVSASDPDRVDPATARELVDIDHPYSNHNGGNLLFGPDGKLYAGMGDGGAANDPHHNGQNPRGLLSKMFRFDVDAREPTAEIVHVGLRNPWRFWFDVPTGDLYIGDVGQDLWEEIDVVAGGDHARHNFGWSVLEGTHCFDASGASKRDCVRDGFTPPVAEYDHVAGCSVTGGVTYRGKALSELDGRYFYADFCTGLLRSFLWTRGVVRDHWDWKPAIDRDGLISQVSSFGTDADGEVYIVLLTGVIYMLARA